MNHLNCFVLEAIARSLEKKLSGQKVLDAFSNSIDDICIEFETGALRSIFYEGTIFFQWETVSPGKNRLFKPQFQDIKGLEVTQVVVHPFERSFHIDIGGRYKLVFKCHGRKSNIMLFDRDEHLDMFKNHLEKDADMHMEDIFRTVNPIFHSEHFKDLKTFCAAYSYLPEEFYGLLKDDTSEQNFQQLIAQYRQIKGILFNDEFVISPVFEQETILEDMGSYTANWLKYIVFKTNKDNLLRRFENSIKEKQNFIRSNQKALEEILTRRSDEEIGNIILSNLHLIKPEDQLVSLHDVYHDRPIEVKLDAKLNAVENAEKYFKKEKNKPLMIQLLQKKIDKAKQDLQTNETKLADLKRAEHFKAIKHLVTEDNRKQDETELPYKRFVFENFEILVGKHAESNEKILNYYSDKNDVWLHAKDVSGSHVLVKMKKQDKIPDNVLEKAASLAAYYSKNRNQSLVTVMYTLRKYVRKIKGADKGKVTVSNEKSILVKPGKG